jgi:hypothetical protein
MKAIQDNAKLPKPNIKDSRVLTYLNQDNNRPQYENTEEENVLVNLWRTKFLIAEQEYESTRVNSKNVQRWRNAYMGSFKALNDQGEETEEDLKALRKMCYELVEQKVNPRIPAPKMTPRYHSDIIPVNATEALIKQEMDRMLSEETHDESEHATLIDSTCWFKVSWDPFDNTHERSGMPVVEVCPIDTVFPQPGVYNYKKLEYIFERKKYTLAQVADLYPDRHILSIDNNDLVEVIECYYLNENRHVGKFAWVEPTLTVLCNDLEWGMRRRRECQDCGKILPIAAKCDNCGSTNIKYVGVKTQKLNEALSFITNPYRSGESVNPEDDRAENKTQAQIPAGTEIPFYLIRQLPFVPKRNTKLPRDLYGISEVQLHLEPQDFINKMYNKAERKSEASKAYVTKLKDTRIDDENKEVAYIEVESHQEAAAIQVKQVTADITEEVTMAQIMYDTSKSTAGVTDTDQGKNDPSARSGKAKQLQMMASQARQAASQIQRNMAYAGVYELIFKYLLAYCDEERSFVKLLPDGTTREEVWSKYMFLDVDKDGNYYYRDDFAWSVDDATEITHDRAAMWQLIDNDYLNGTMGNEIDPVRALRMYWHMKNQAGYPTAKFAVAFLEEAVKKLPTQVEQALVNNPEAVELALSFIADMQAGKGLGGQNPQSSGQHGGARDGAGKPNNGQTHAAQQQKANNQSRAAQGQQTNLTAAATGGAQGGIQNDTR